MKPLILTFAGRHVNPLDLRPEDIDIRDIAHALALCNRFAGHSERPISVAQHSVYVARLVETYLNDSSQKSMLTRLELGRQALLHDASEAYLGDVTKWLKGTPEFFAYREAEERVQTQIYSFFGSPTVLHPLNQDADKQMLRFEGEKAFGLSAWTKWVETLPNYPLISEVEREEIGNWAPWSWQEAERLFLTYARSLGLFPVTEGDPIYSRSRK